MHQDIKETTLSSIFSLILITHQCKNMLQQWKSLRIANKERTFEYTEQSDSVALFSQLQKHQNTIMAFGRNFPLSTKKTEYVNRIADFLINFDTNVTIPYKSFINTMVQNLLSEQPAPQKQKILSTPITSSPKSRSDITHRDRIHPHSYIP